jgi:hypothetical protein
VGRVEVGVARGPSPLLVSRILVARVLVVGPASASLASCLDPLRVSTETTFQGLVGICVLAAGCGLTIDDVFGTDLADFVCDGGDDVAAKLLGFAEVLTLESELVLLRHVVPSSCTDLVHDVQENSFGSTLALCSVLGGVANVSSRHIHGAIGGECNAIRELLAPA